MVGFFTYGVGVGSAVLTLEGNTGSKMGTLGSGA